MTKNKLSILTMLFILQAFFLQAQSNDLPSPIGFVSDYADILLGGDKYAIEELGTEAKQKSGAEVALLTVKTIEPYASIEEYANAVFNKWGIGEKGKDNGVLIVLSTNERLLRIEVGYGLEGAITDGNAGFIMDKFMIPYFKHNDFATGLVEGYKAVMVLVAKEYNFEISGFSDREYSIEEEAGKTPLILKILGLLFFLFFFGSFGGIWLLVILSFFGAFRKGFGGGFDGGKSGFGGRSSFSSSSRSSFSRSSSSSFSRGSSGGGGSSRRF